MSQVEFQPFETLLELKGDHEVLGEQGELYVIRDSVFNLDTDSYKLSLGKVNTEERLVTVGFDSCVIGKENIETYFNIAKISYGEYKDKIQEKFPQ